MSLFGSISKNVGGSVVRGIGSFLGDAFTAAAPAVGAFLSYKQQDALMQKQMDFQERMSNTAHQREVADLVKAGINPLYTATGGNGASTPVGSTGTQTDFANAFGSGIGIATSRRLQRAMQEAQIQNLGFQNMKAEQEAWNTHYAGQLMEKQVQNYDKRLNAELELMRMQAYAALHSGAASSANASYLQENTLTNRVSRQGDESFYQFLRKHPVARNIYNISRSFSGHHPSASFHRGFSGASVSY